MSLLERLFAPSASSTDNEPEYLKLVVAGEYAAALPLLDSAVRGGDGRAMAVLATLHAFGRGVPQSLEDAADWFRQAAVRGHVEGMAAYGACLANGHGVAENHGEAAMWLARSARRGYGQAVEALSDLALRSPQAVALQISEHELHLLVVERHRLEPSAPPTDSLH